MSVLTEPWTLPPTPPLEPAPAPPSAWPRPVPPGGGTPPPGAPSGDSGGRFPRARSLAVAALVGMVAAGVAIMATRLPQGARPTLSSAPVPQSAPAAATVPTSPPSNEALSADAIAAAADPSIVDVNTTLGFGEGEGAGTGMILSTSGLILTNNHVIDGATTISVRLVGTGRSYPATVVGTDVTDDVAVIKIDGVGGLKPIALGDSSTVAVGDTVVAIGNAGGVGGTPSVVTGTVTALDQAVTVSDEDGSNPENLSGLIQTNAPIQPGDSGGPLFNQSGQVIGIDTAASVGGGRRFRASSAEGLTIPINSALTIAHQIEAGEASATVHIGLPGFLGVEIDPTASNGTGGAPVVGVIPGSPAATTGLGSGAVITSLDGQPIGSADDLTAATASHHPGDKVSLGWTDAAGRQRHATVTLTSGPAS